MGHEKVNVVFRDEELLPDTVIEHVDYYRKQPWIDMKWYCVRLKSEKQILDHAEEIEFWGDGREWVRPMPEWAIKEPRDRLFDQTSMDTLVAEHYTGKLAYIVGIRAEESLQRYRSVVNKLNENYICGSSARRAKIVKPIYDWKQTDIFKFLYDSSLPFTEQYRVQNLARNSFRVATPLHPEGVRAIGKVREQTPEFWNRLVEVFPEVGVQARWGKQFDTDSFIRKYGETFEGARQFVRDRVDDPKRAKDAMEVLDGFERLHISDPDTYTVKFIFRQVIRGITKRKVPLPGTIGQRAKVKA
jgi:predicted phosphoadenosine phosphosulfate sulfurtransferase